MEGQRRMPITRSRNPLALERLYWRIPLLKRLMDWSDLRTYGFTWEDRVKFQQELQERAANLRGRESMVVSNIKSQFGDRVRQLREQRGWSLTELAQRYSGSRSYLYQVERGQSSPTLEMVQSLAEAFGYPLPLLLGADETAEQAWQQGYEAGCRDTQAKVSAAMAMGLAPRAPRP